MGDVKWSDARRIGWADVDNYTEGPNNWNKYADCLDNIDSRELHDGKGPYFNYRKQNVAYCSVFVNYCVYKAAYPDPRGTAYAALYEPRNPRDNCAAGCEFAAGYFKQAGKWYHNPEPGDVFFTRGYGHTGFVDKVNGDGTFTTLESNTGNPGGTHSKTRHVRDMEGFGRPWWTPEDEPTPEPKPEPSGKYTGTWPTIPSRGYFQKGDKGVNVKRMQEVLLWLKPDCLPRYGADGDLGSETYAAVKACQQILGVVVDGLYGPKTQAAAKAFSKKAS